MFDLFVDWHDPPGFNGLIQRDQPVRVDTHLVWPYGDGINTMSLAPQDASEHGLHVDSLTVGRLIAWVRRSSGSWFGVIEVHAGSRSGDSSVTMTLWVPPAALKPLDPI